MHIGAPKTIQLTLSAIRDTHGNDDTERICMFTDEDKVCPARIRTTAKNIHNHVTKPLSLHVTSILFL
jgi:hypothetical protein